MLTALRWREYAVTFLQTQSVDCIGPLLVCAASMLREASSTDPGEIVLKSYGGHLVYFDWRKHENAILVRILQEGLGHRRQDVPRDLEDCIGQFLVSRWDRGDAFDRVMVLETGGLMRSDILLEKVTWAIEHGPDYMKNAAFRACRFLEKLSDDVTKWLRRQLSDKILMAHKSADLARIRAWASHLPDSVGANFVVTRSELLQRVFRLILDEAILRIFIERNTVFRHEEKEGRRRTFLTVFVPVTCMYGFIPIGLGFGGIQQIDWLQGTVVVPIVQGGCIGLAAGLLILIGVYLTRSVGEPITVQYVCRKALSPNLRKALHDFLLPLVVVFVFFAIPGAVVHAIASFFFHETVTPIWYFLSGFIAMTIVAVGLIISRLFSEMAAKERLESLKPRNSDKLPLALHARSLGELNVWLRDKKRSVVGGEREIRSLLRVLCVDESATIREILKAPLFQSDWAKYSRRVAMQSLLERVSRIEAL